MEYVYNTMKLQSKLFVRHAGTGNSGDSM